MIGKVDVLQRWGVNRNMMFVKIQRSPKRGKLTRSLKEKGGATPRLGKSEIFLLVSTLSSQIAIL